MRLPHFSEIMDQDWLPAGLHATLREILECGLSRPFRRYNDWVAEQVCELVAMEKYEQVVELAAGSAPITRLLAGDERLKSVRLVACDLRPDARTYDDLARRFPGRVFPMLEPVDFSQPRQWPPHTLLVISGSFHHLPPAERIKALGTLTSSARRIFVCEPLRRSALSALFASLSFIPGIVLPLRYVRRPGLFRRVFWCWLFPVAPVALSWDGVVSCLRMWSEEEWRTNLRLRIGIDRSAQIKRTAFCHAVTW